MTTPLKALLLRRIRAMGPITLADYMAECLLHPEYGYYTTREPFGAAGDFITAPEISQMFGELLGLALAQAWLDQGAPAPFVLAELGPGRGTLMADLLRATRAVPGFHSAMRLHLVEASPALRARQQAAIAPHMAIWGHGIDDLPQAPLFLVANEFFDALPIRQFQRQGDGWSETLVGTGPQGAEQSLAFGRGAAVPLQALAHRLADTPQGGIVETCPQAQPIAAEIGARIATQGGLALIVDYGDWGGRGDTFQAMRAHGYADPLAAPGQADLTAHVDFAALAQAARPARAHFTTQGAFLQALGLPLRAEHLARGLAGPALSAHLAAARRLTADAEMGSLFKVLALTPATAPAPPGMPRLEQT